MNQHFVCVGIEIETQRCIGVDFCKDEAELRFKADMFREDFGDGFLIIEYPSRNELAVQTAFEVMALACEHSALVATRDALARNSAA